MVTNSSTSVQPVSRSGQRNQSRRSPLLRRGPSPGAAGLPSGQDLKDILEGGCTVAIDISGGRSPDIGHGIDLDRLPPSGRLIRTNWIASNPVRQDPPECLQSVVNARVPPKTCWLAPPGPDRGRVKSDGTNPGSNWYAVASRYPRWMSPSAAPWTSAQLSPSGLTSMVPPSRTRSQRRGLQDRIAKLHFQTPRDRRRRVLGIVRHWMVKGEDQFHQYRPPPAPQGRKPAGRVTHPEVRRPETGWVLPRRFWREILRLPQTGVVGHHSLGKGVSKPIRRTTWLLRSAVWPSPLAAEVCPVDLPFIRPVCGGSMEKF